MNLTEPRELAPLLEAFLLASGKPQSLERLYELFEEGERPEPPVFRKALELLRKSCEGRAFELREVASGYRLQIREKYSPWVGRLWEERPQRYSRAMLETMALIAYRQPITRGEMIMLGVFAILLVLWAGIPAMLLGAGWAVDATTTAFIGLSLCLVTGVLTWDDVIKEKSAWDTIVWFGALVMMATFLNKLGLIGWFAKSMETGIGHLGLGWVGASALLMLTYLYAHYAFASTTAHITAMFAAFYGAGLALGAPALPFALMMAAASNIMMTLTHYATGTSPVVFGSGYVTLGQWWKTGFIMSVVLILIWLVVGGAWWKALGYW